jgi:protein-S-isoprenylcysteine O-methyltransferase Ste14
VNATTPEQQSNRESETASAIRKRMVQVVVTFLLLAAILFVSAGTLEWPMAWAYLGVGLGILVLNALILLPRQPEMVAERSHTKEDAKGWDRVLGTLMTMTTLVTLIVAGLDKRFGWSPAYTLAIHLLALLLLALGQGLFTWSMASNKFFSRAVRIQTDRGHTVESGGPYGYVRHPGYVGLIISTLATPLVLGSLWALPLAGLVVVGHVTRTALEDRTLLVELEGYADYAQQVRYRLLPGVW